MSNQEILTLWKAEPLSPGATPSPQSIDDEWFCFNDDPADLKADESDIYDEHPTRAQIATKLLEELDEWIKEEPFSDWLEDKISLPIFEELPIPECGQNKAVAYPNIYKQQPLQQHHSLTHYLQHHPQDTTQSLLQEFETIFGDVEACHQSNSTIQVSTLTPPQSPPPKEGLVSPHQLLVTLQPVQQQGIIYQPQPSLVAATRIPAVAAKTQIYHENHQHHHHHQQQQQQQQQEQQPIPNQWSAENLSLAPLGGDVAHELAEVDEYVRSCVEDIAPSSPCTSTNGSSISSEDSNDDPDWTIESSSSHSSEGTTKRGARSGGYAKNRRSKPYSRPSLEDKKVRKKEQNKNAATRYRQKKKQEIKEIIGEEQELAEHNETLHNQVKDLQREIGYLKGLMRDLFKAKGLMK